MSTRTITLSGRPPVRIDEDNWPTLASASDSNHDGQVECQANTKWSWWVRVRQHADGRTIVYAGYDYETAWMGKRDYRARAGELLPIYDTDVVCRTICEVCELIATTEADQDHSARWATLAAECIADMPAEELS